MSAISRRTFLGMTGALGAGTLLGFPQRAEAALRRESRVLLGTFVEVTVAGVSSLHADDVFGRAFAEACRLDGILSRHAPGTPLAELNRAGRLADAPAELLAVLGAARRCGAATGGAFDLTVQPVVDYLRAHSNPKGRMRLDPAELAAARALVDADAVELRGRGVRLNRAGMGVTLDGIAKGYIADRMGAELAALGVTDYLINAGGDIVARGQKAPGLPWRVAVASPFRADAHPAELALQNRAIATSGGYEQYYDAAHTHSHLVDPATGQSPLGTVSVSVTAPTAMEADALATGLSAMSVPDAMRLIRGLPGRECLLVLRSGQVIHSAGWRA